MTAICFGYYAHPRGSTIFHRSGRTWRLSPVFAAFETATLLVRLINGVWTQSLRVVCFSLLTVRAGNAWHPSECEAFLKAEHRRSHDSEEASLLPTRRRNEVAHTGGSSLSAPTSQQSSDNVEAFDQVGLRPLTEGHGQHNHLRAVEPMPEYPPTVPSSEPSERSSNSITDIGEKQKEEQDLIFEEHMRIVGSIDGGPQFRIFIFIPMFCQFLKLCVTTGSPWSRVIASIFLSSWLLEEIIMMYALQEPLSPLEQRQVISFSRKYRKHFQTKCPKNDKIFQWDDIENTPRVGFLAWLCAASLNVVMTGVFWFDGRDIKVTPLPPRGIYQILVFVCSLLWIPFYGIGLSFFISFPCIPLCFYSFFSVFWRMTGAERLFGTLYFETWIRDIYPWFQGHVAVYGAVLSALWYGGAFAGERNQFQCWNTSKPSYYDWLG